MASKSRVSTKSVVNECNATKSRMRQPLISQGVSDKFWTLDQSKEVVVVIQVETSWTWSRVGKREKRIKTNQPKECYGPERSGGIRMAETKSKERNVEAVKADDEVEGQAN